MSVRHLATSILLLAAVSGAPVAAQRADFYVSPRGSDAWSGTLVEPNGSRTDGPFATVARAQAAVRALRAREPDRGTRILVLLRGGVYQLDATLDFTAEDSGTDASPTVYASYPGEKPVISGGVRLRGWRVGDDGRWRLHLPEVQRGEWTFGQLFVNGERRYRPRLPKDGYRYIAGDVPATPENEGKGYDRFQYAEGDVDPAWTDLDDTEFVCFHLWGVSRLRPRSVDAGSRVATFTGPTAAATYWSGLAKGWRYLIDNVADALSDPGEWYLDRRSGTLTYIPLPGEDPTAAEVIAPRIETLVRLRGDPTLGVWVEHLSFRGISFSHANWTLPPGGASYAQAEIGTTAAIEATGARHCSWRGCTVSHVGAYGIHLGLACRLNRVDSCVLTDLGAGGVKLGEPYRLPDPETDAGWNVISNNMISHGGRMHPAGIGVLVLQTSFNLVEHNTITDFYYTGVSVGWTWGYAPSNANHNTIAWNHIYRIGQGVLSDMGGIYTLGIADGSVLHHNRIHDVESFEYGGWGIYFDEGTTHMLAENNLVYRVKTGTFHQHYGRENEARNNILAFARTGGQLIRTRVEEHLSFTLDHNIVYWDEGPLLGSNWGGDKYRLDHNLYWQARGEPFDFAGMTFEQWQAKGQDVHSKIADPLFVDPEHNDFRLKPGSPALELGFVPFDVNDAGCHLPKDVLPPTNVPSAFPTTPAPPPPPPVSARPPSMAAAAVGLASQGKELDPSKATEADGLTARYGTGTRVIVNASVPPIDCHRPTVMALQALAEQYPDALTVNVCRLRTPAGDAVTKPLGMQCAAYLINGSAEFGYDIPDVGKRTAVFAHFPGGTYTLDELRGAVLSALKDAGVDVKEDPIAATGPTEWPNEKSSVNSDAWLIQNHDRLRRMKPRVLVLNFANGYAPPQAEDIVTRFAKAISESSRYHGYKDPSAPAFLEYQIVKIADLCDKPMIPGREKKNSRWWPRDGDKKGSVDYGKFFTDEYTKLIDFRTEDSPDEPVSIADLVNDGRINELWFIGSHNEEDAAFESVELKQVYDDMFQPNEGEHRQAGNGGDDRQPWLGRSMRICWINPDRGIGCAMENLGHSLEGMAHANVIPYFTRYFYDYAGFDLDKRYGLPVNSFYACGYEGGDMVEWLSPTSIKVHVGDKTYTVDDYVPAGGNVHFPPNGRHHYDIGNSFKVMSTIENYRLHNGADGKDLATEWSPDAYAQYQTVAPDCMGPWLVYWRQNMPGLGSKCVDDDGRPMKNWWPFLFY